MVRVVSPHTVSIWYVPVVHQGYVRLWQKDQERVISGEHRQWLLTPAFAASLEGIAASPATLGANQVAALMARLVGVSPKICTGKTTTSLQMLLTECEQAQHIQLVSDQVMRSFWQMALVMRPKLTTRRVQWRSVFLRWDAARVFAQSQFQGPITQEKSARDYMQIAQSLAEKSGDWWRQVGAIAVKNNSIIVQGYNQGMPSDHTPYQQGAVRDYVPIGQSPELANYIHAEQIIVAKAAAEGVSLRGSEVYVTHFPCPVCAKLLAQARVSKVYFAFGSASLDGAAVLTAFGIKLMKVDIAHA